jgi:hypothetical protein
MLEAALRLPAAGLDEANKKGAKKAPSIRELRVPPT